MAKTETKKEDAPRGKKGDGPVVISYLDASGAESKRVSENTTAIRIADKDGGAVDFSIADLSDAAKLQLAILGVVKRVDTFVRNGAKQDGANVISLANTVINSLKEGTIYSRKEGGGSAGRPFDFDFWRVVIAATAKARGKDASDKQLDGWITKLKAMTPGDRKAYLTKLKSQDPVFNVSFKKAEAARLASQVKKEGGAPQVDALADLF